MWVVSTGDQNTEVDIIFSTRLHEVPEEFGCGCGVFVVAVIEYVNVTIDRHWSDCCAFILEQIFQNLDIPCLSYGTTCISVP
jgi:hypothetical protein